MISAIDTPADRPGLDVRALLRIASRRRFIILGCIILAVALAVTIIAGITPRYTAEAVLVLDTRKTQVVEFQSVVSDLPPDPSVIRTELDVLSSRSMAERVVDRLGLVESGLPPMATPARPPFIERPLILAAELSRQVADVLRGGPDATEEATEEEQDEEPTPDDIRNNLTNALLGGLQVSNDGQSYTIYIDFDSPDPEFSATVANAFADQYLESQVDEKIGRTERANRWLIDRLHDLRQKANESEQAVQAYREREGLLLEKGASLTEQQLEEVNTQLMLAKHDRIEAEARLHTARDLKNGGNVEAYADVLASEVIVSLRQQESEIRRKEAELLNLKTPLHPELKAVQSDLASVHQQIREEVNRIVQNLANAVETARSREASLEVALAAVKGKLENAARAELKLRQLEQEADANRQLYELLLNRSKETSTQEQLHDPDARIISYAEVPVMPSYPRTLPFIALALAIGGFLGMVLALLLETLDQSLRSVEQVERLTGLPVLALMPSVPALGRAVRRTQPQDYVLKRRHSLLTDSLRTARTAIQLTQTDRPSKIIWVTSSVPQEGKTAFCLSLARLFAAEGGRVLLIDADLRRPGIARALGDRKTSDLVDLLRGERMLDEVLQVDPKSGAHYIAAHTSVPNPEALLGSDRMKFLLLDLQSVYDLILIDTPPILTAPDGAIIARLADICLFFVRWGGTKREVAASALRRLEIYKIKVAGVILSRVNMRKHTSYGLGESYYYR